MTAIQPFPICSFSRRAARRDLLEVRSTVGSPKNSKMKMPMKKATLLATLVLSSLYAPLPSKGQGQDIESMPPVVVKTVPEAGAGDVAPGMVEIKVTFSKEMADNSWSWSTVWQGSTPEAAGKPKYEAD